MILVSTNSAYPHVSFNQAMSQLGQYIQRLEFQKSGRVISLDIVLALLRSISTGLNSGQFLQFPENPAMLGVSFNRMSQVAPRPLPIGPQNLLEVSLWTVCRSRKPTNACFSSCVPPNVLSPHHCILITFAFPVMCQSYPTHVVAALVPRAPTGHAPHG